MKSIIEEIYFGKRGNAEGMKPSEEYWKAHDEVSRKYEDLEKQLTEEQKKQFQELYLIMGGLESEHGISQFKEGFKVGLLVAIEVFL